MHFIWKLVWLTNKLCTFVKLDKIKREVNESYC